MVLTFNQAISAQRQKSDMQAALDRANKSSASRMPAPASNDAEVEELRRELARLRSSMDEVSVFVLWTTQIECIGLPCISVQLMTS